MKTLMILNDAPYGSERTYNGARLAGAFAKEPDAEVHVFLMGDAAAAAHNKQKVPAGSYNLEVMLGSVVKQAGAIGVCGTCMDARGIAAEDLVEGSHRSSMDELTQWTTWAEKVLVF
ncbi:MAG: DsrE family protein [Pseudomonadota bacterium]|nr:DsrE family protein [Pseudomonadota bacterium]